MLVHGALENAQPAAATGGRVLIVEDEGIVAADLQQTLCSLGYDADAVATSGAEALECAQALCPQIALMDIHLRGGMDGIETAARLRERFGTGIIFLTAHADDSTLERAARCEPYGYLVKPVSTAVLKSTLQLTVHRWHADRLRREHEHLERRRQMHLSTALRHLHAGIVIEDEHGIVSCSNERLAVLFGLSTDLTAFRGHSGRQLAEHISRCVEDPAQFLARVEQIVRDGATVSGEIIRLHGGLVLERDFAPIAEHGVPTGAVWSYRDVSERERQRESLEQRASEYHDLSHGDELTGLLNRRGFFARARRQLTLADRDGLQVALMYVDLNGLKQINDSLGHAVGDQALREMALILRVVFRGADVVARLGGDEFVILYCSRTGDAATVAERVRARLQQFNSSAHQPYELRASVGIVTREGDEPIETLLHRGDAAMYGDKRVGKSAAQLA